MVETLCVVIGEEKTSTWCTRFESCTFQGYVRFSSFKDVTVKPMPWKRVSSLAVSSSGTSGVVLYVSVRKMVLPYVVPKSSEREAREF